jgi:2-polyprenyl-3-methyl-5-hydroxy-6-metoxy-1,4-benzoquinol methylase
MLGDAVFERAADVGCANGWLLRELQDHSVIKGGVGVDIEAEMLASAQQESSPKYPDLAFVTPAEAVPLKRTFDLVCCLETLEHVEDIGALISVRVS